MNKELLLLKRVGNKFQVFFHDVRGNKTVMFTGFKYKALEFIKNLQLGVAWENVNAYEFVIAKSGNAATYKTIKSIYD